MLHRTKRAATVALALALLGLGACSGDEDVAEDDATATTTTAASDAATSTTAAPDEPLRILLTNDDGIGAPGIDAVAEALAALPDVELNVVAPAENQSGSAGKTTPGAPAGVASATASGRAGFAVPGFPADSVIWALDGGGVAERPHLVVSGINSGQNIGSFVELSGTVGAARAAASLGVPALAASQGFGEPPDFATGVRFVVEWVSEHRDALVAGTQPVAVESLNVPTCTAGTVRGLVEVPVAADDAGRDLLATDCTSTATDPADDVAAFTTGYVALSDVGLG